MGQDFRFIYDGENAAGTTEFVFGSLPSFNFKNFALNYMAVHIDGQQDVIKPIQPNFTTGHYIRSFSNFFMGIGKLHKDQGIIIDRADYRNGYTLYAFDLSPDMSSGGNFNLIRTGSVRLDMKFATALPNTINVVVYAEFENIIEIMTYNKCFLLHRQSL